MRLAARKHVGETAADVDVDTRRYYSIGRWLTAPAFIYAVVVTQVPFLFTLYYSTFRWNLMRPDRKANIGLQNYKNLISSLKDASDPYAFRASTINTLIFTIGAVVLSLLLGLFYAELAVVPGAGHAYALEAPQESLGLLLDWRERRLPRPREEAHVASDR